MKKKRGLAMDRRKSFFGGIMTIVIVILLALSAAGCGVSRSGELISLEISPGLKIPFQNVIKDREQASEEAQLPLVGSYENLVSILEKMYGENQWGIWKGMVLDGAAVEAEAMKSPADSAAAKSGATDFSTTNVQVQGVDEADIVKTDGEYIYQVKDRKITVTKAYPAEEMKLVNTLAFEGEFYPVEMYLDEEYLVVIGSSNRRIPLPETEKIEPDFKELVEPESAVDIERKPWIAPGIWPPYSYQPTTQVRIYDAEEPEKLQLVREFEIEGYYITSRKIESRLYLIANRSLYYYIKGIDGKYLVPWYRDSKSSEEFQPVEPGDIRYFPDMADANYLMIVALNLDRMDDKVDLSTYLGSGQTVYASRENLYVAVEKWVEEKIGEGEAEIQASVNGDSVKVDTADETEAVTVRFAARPFVTVKQYTHIYKFALEDGRTEYLARGEVPGRLLNQFSMDEHNGYFRIATTVNDEMPSKNNLYVLGSSMETVGKIENIAPDERIYSVRFMGDRAYMVTFKTVDPLFVIDLKDPENPTILGELKIPGYSSYLHPYDENHIIGFGMDAVEVALKDENGQVYGTTAYQLGMKVALFDVSDVNNPVEKFHISIGDRGTYSEMLYNHKALLFSREKNILAFPVTVMETKDKWMDRDKTIPNYGEFAFQGLYVFGLDLENGFTLKARITHLTPDEIKNARWNWYDYEKTVERALYIHDTLYALSRAGITAHSMDNYEKIAELSLR